MMRDYVDIADQYAAAVILGQIVAGDYVKLACQRYLDDKQRQTTDIGFDFQLSADRATHACRFIEAMPHIKGKFARGDSRLIMEPWQVFATVNLFGWIDQDGLRRFRYAYIEVAKKNGKSTWLAAISLYMATADNEPGPEVYTAATNYDQAKIVWTDAKAMLLKSPALAERYGAKTTIYDVQFDANNGVFKPLATDKGGSKDGLNIHMAAVDELHAHKDAQTYDIVASGIASREQGMVFAITTAGTDVTGVAYRERTNVIKTLTGQADLVRYFGLIYCLDAKDDWRDPANWIKANPSLGITIGLEYLTDKLRKVGASPSSEAEFRQKSLNEWVGSANAWIDSSSWANCADAGLRESDCHGLPAFGGVDLASKLDLAGYSILYAKRLDGSDKPHWFAFTHQYINETAIKSAAARSAENAASRTREVGNAEYPVWFAQGYLTVTPGNVTDQDVIERDLIERHAVSPFTELGFDDFNATMLAGHLQDEGLPMVTIPMRVNPLSPAMRWLEELILDGRLHHDGNPVLSWCMGNVEVKPDNNQNLFPRKGAPERKIDAAVALIMAASRAMLWDSMDVFEAHTTPDQAMADYLANIVVLR